jgi:FG-GAP repeat
MTTQGDGRGAQTLLLGTVLGFGLGCVGCWSDSVVGTSGKLERDGGTAETERASVPSDETEGAAPPNETRAGGSPPQPGAAQDSAEAEPPPASEAEQASRRRTLTRIMPDPKRQFGPESRSVGDVDGDGYDDFALVSRPTRIEGDRYVPHGVVHLFYGEAKLPEELSAEHSDAEFVGGVSWIRELGDINGDALADFAICGGGWLQVIFGSSNRFAGEVATDSTGLRWVGLEPPSMSFPDAEVISISAAGDVNGDGIDDVLVNAASEFKLESNVDEGWESLEALMTLHLLLGHTGDWPSGQFDASWMEARIVTGADSISNSVYAAQAGDLDADGFDDLLLSHEGGQSILYGADNAFHGELDAMRDATPLQASTRISYAPAGDVDGDGRADLSRYENERTGLVYSPAERWPANATPEEHLQIQAEADSQPWFSLPPAADIDGDGHKDLIIVSELRKVRQPDGSDNKTDAIYVIRGTSQRFTGQHQLTEADIYAQGLFLEAHRSNEYGPLGLWVDTTGDIDGDGSADLLATATNSVEGVTNENKGGALVLRGAPATPQ